MRYLGILGFGNMGEAMAAGVRGSAPGLPIGVHDVKAEKRDLARNRYGLAVFPSPGELVAAADRVVLAVKPQDADALLPEIREASRGKGFISLLAGRQIRSIRDGLATDQVCRFMPNIAARKGKALTAVCFAPGAGEEFKADCMAVAGAMGTAMELPEKLFAAFTGICGCGIGFALSFIHSMALGGVAAGLDYPTALKAAAAAAEGAVSLLSEPGSHPVELLTRVTSAGGSTIQGVRELEKSGFSGAAMEAVESAARKAGEMEEPR
jgi:pyrroline-5-carboxylate reductase